MWTWIKTEWNNSNSVMTVIHVNVFVEHSSIHKINFDSINIGIQKLGSHYWIQSNVRSHIVKNVILIKNFYPIVCIKGKWRSVQCSPKQTTVSGPKPNRWVIRNRGEIWRSTVNDGFIVWINSFYQRLRPWILKSLIMIRETIRIVFTEIGGL